MPWAKEARPTYGALRRSLLAHGCSEETEEIFPGHDGPHYRFLVKAGTGRRVPIDHWLQDEDEEITPSFCRWVCRQLEISEKEISFDSGGGNHVRVSDRPREPAN